MRSLSESSYIGLNVITLSAPKTLSKKTCQFLFLLCTCLPAAGVAMSEAEAERQAALIMEITREEVEARLEMFDGSMLDYRVDDAVYRRVVNYLRDWPISSGRVLARSARFYPIFEEQLTAAGLPLDLKHLSIVESALRSWAVSPVGAGGLWQLMPGTARELGLIVSDELDERLDPTLGCAAGLEYLRIQRDRYGDWALALAAYNSGPGNVNRAIRRSGSRNYWRLRRFLPRETRDYVPNFIAATFLMVYHHRYGLPASQISLDDQLTERITVRRRISLYRIAQVTGLRPEVVIELNPQYLYGYLPGLRGGHLLQLPKRVVPAMLEYLALHPAETPEHQVVLPWADPRLAAGEVNADRFYLRYEVMAAPTDTSTRQIAERHAIPVDRMLVWSQRGESDSITTGESFYYYDVDMYRPYDPRPRETMEPAPLLASRQPRRLSKVGLNQYFGPLPQPDPVPHVPIGESWLEKIVRGLSGSR